MHKWQGVMAGCGILAASAFQVIAAGPLTVQLRGTSALSSAMAVDQNETSFTIAGVSGIAYLGADATAPDPGSSHIFAAVMDNSNKLLRLRVRFNADGSIQTVEVLGGVALSASHDFEGVAPAARHTEHVLLCEEDTPAVRRHDLVSGAELSALPLPAIFSQRRPNFGLEAIATRLPPAGSATVWTANEEALNPDGPVSSPSTGTLVRLQRMSGQMGLWNTDGQWGYLTEPMHGSSINGARSGVSDLVVLPDGRVLVLERSLAFSLGGLFRTRIYEVGFAGATDTSGLATLTLGGYTVSSKSLLWQGNLNNLEGLCLGPVLADGSRVLVGVVDDGDPVSTTQIVSFSLNGLTEPETVDLDWDFCVDLADLIAFLEPWITSLGGAAAEAEADVDVNTDGLIDLADLVAFLNDWLVRVGQCQQ